MSKPWLILTLVGAASAAALFSLATQLRIDNSWSAFLPVGDPQVAVYEAFRARFGEDGFVLILGRREASPEARADLQRALAELDGVGRLVGPGQGPLGRRLFARDDRPAWWLEPTPGLAPARRDRLIRRMLALLADHPAASSPPLIAGPLAVNAFLDQGSTTSFARLFPLSIALIALVLLVALREPRMVVAVLATAFVAASWTLAIVALAGRSLNMVLVVLPALMLVLTTAYSLHQVCAFALTEGPSLEARWRAALSETRAPCLLAVLTTAAGLASLGLSELPPVRDLGLFGALGLVIAYLLTATLLPALARALGATGARASTRAEPRSATRRRVPRGLWPALALAISAAATLGLAELRVESHVLRFFPDEHPLVRATAEAERDWFGQTPLEIWLRGSRATICQPEAIAALRALVDELARLEGATAVVSPLEAAPQLATMSPSLAAVLMRAGLNDAAARHPARLRVEGERVDLRLTVALRTLPNAACVRAAAQAEAALARHQIAGVESSVTGAIPILARTQQLLLRTQLETFAGAFLLVSLILLAAFRDRPGLAALSLIPNLLPVLWTLGLMGAVGVHLNVATVTVAGIAFGLVVDDTIHILYRYRVERREHQPRAAIDRVLRSSGRAVLITSLAVAIGFSALAAAAFQPTRWFGGLIALTALLALACDLVLLPALLLWRQR